MGDKLSRTETLKNMARKTLLNLKEFLFIYFYLNLVYQMITYIYKKLTKT